MTTASGIRTLVTGRGLVEAPRWHDGRLYFSDWDAGEVLAVDPSAGGGTAIHARVASSPCARRSLRRGRFWSSTPPVTGWSAGRQTGR
jgi:hypothetical protein